MFCNWLQLSGDLWNTGTQIFIQPCDDDDDEDLYSAIIHVSMLKAQVSVRKKGTHKKEDRQQHTKTK